MVKVISTREAQITTVAIEVKAIKVGAKQVTLSMFRQLHKEQIIQASYDGRTLKGVPWGRVNCCPGDCGISWGHDHIVWQCGGEPRRGRAPLAGPGRAGGQSPPGSSFCALLADLMAASTPLRASLS